MAVRPLVLVAALPALVAAGCGDTEPPAPPPKAVRLELLAPADAAVIDEDTATVQGRVSPAASAVRVGGRDAAVQGGTFSEPVELEPGANVIDVAASADGRRPALTAVRVVRRLPVEVPDVEGEDVDTAVERLEGLGLGVELEAGGGLFDELLPGEAAVCSTDPEAGEEVRSGTTVVVRVAKGC